MHSIPYNSIFHDEYQIADKKIEGKQFVIEQTSINRVRFVK